MKILTDHKWKQFKYRHEVPKKVLAEDFDWLHLDEVDGFFCYKRRWYHTSEFTQIGCFSPIPAEWHGYSSDTFFSGVLIKISEDGDTYKVATYYS